MLFVSDRRIGVLPLSLALSGFRLNYPLWLMMTTRAWREREGGEERGQLNNEGDDQQMQSEVYEIFRELETQPKSY